MDFATLFAGTAYISAICLFVGLVFCAIECFVPGFGFFGITGGILTVFAIVYRMIIGGTWWHLFYLCIFTILFMAIVIIVAVSSARHGFISKTDLIEKETALPKDFTLDNIDYKSIKGKEGVAVTVCKPVGKMKIDKTIYQVISNGEYIEKDSKLKVIDIDGTTIVVKKI